MIRISKIETLGTFDGPGLRTVFFLQGCPLRCLYCHNPETQNPKRGQSYGLDDLLNLVASQETYYQVSGGGVTFSGGEPLLQSKELLPLVRALKDRNIHIALDTSGFGDLNEAKALLPFIDLVLLDVKAIKEEDHRYITGGSPLKGLLDFMSLLTDFAGEVWVRHVMLPGRSDQKAYLDDLHEFCKPLHPRLAKYEILPYHEMGIEKYSQLNMPYQLAGLGPMDPEKAKALEKYVNDKLMD